MLGAIIGDICGSVYEFRPVKSKDDIAIFHYQSRFTDDTVLTVAIADALLQQKCYTENLVKFAKENISNRGYGQRFFRWIFSKEHKPYGSYGNGSAMRVSPIGFYFNTIDEVLEEAKKSAEITHNHPEGIKGAQAVALAVFLARKKSTKEQIKNEITNRFGYNLEQTVEDIGKNNRHDETCQKSVPEAIVAFLESTDFESAIVNAILLRGDSDTQACIAGAIAEAYYKEIPIEFIKNTFKYIPDSFVQVIEDFYRPKETKFSRIKELLFLQKPYKKIFPFEDNFTPTDTTEANLLFNEDEYERIQKGFASWEMEEKWDLFFRSYKLYFQRSWLPQDIIYIAHFTKINEHYQLTQIDISNDLKHKDSRYVELCNFLICNLLLNKKIPYPVDNNSEYPAIEAWANVGSVAFE